MTWLTFKDGDPLGQFFDPLFLNFLYCISFNGHDEKFWKNHVTCQYLSQKVSVVTLVLHLYLHLSLWKVFLLLTRKMSCLSSYQIIPSEEWRVYYKSTVGRIYQPLLKAKIGTAQYGGVYIRNVWQKHDFQEIHHGVYKNVYFLNFQPREDRYLHLEVLLGVL